MTFKKLQKGLGRSCICAKLGPAIENTTDTFARIVKGASPSNDSFLSWYDEGKRWSAGAECKTKCKFRGMSMNKIDEANETELIETFADRVRNKPSLGSHCLKFRVHSGAGLVWATPSTNSESHHTLLQSDDFSVKHIIKVDAVKLV